MELISRKHRYRKLSEQAQHEKRVSLPTDSLASILGRGHGHDSVPLASPLVVRRNIGTYNVASTANKVLEILPLHGIRQIADVERTARNGNVLDDAVACWSKKAR